MSSVRQRLILACTVLLGIATLAAAMAGEPRRISTPKRSLSVPTAGPQPLAVMTPYALASGHGLPPIPAVPPGSGKYRRIRSANGTTITVAAGAGCGNVGYTVSIGCTMTATVTKPAAVAGTEAGYLLAPGATTPVAYTFGTATVLNTQGFYVFGAFNTTSNVWDDLVYVAVGNIATLRAYDNTGAQIDTATVNGTTRISFVGSSLTVGDSYAIGAESTSKTGYCAWLGGGTAAPVATAAGSLCNPVGGNAIPIVATSSGTINATWQPSATLNGAMSVSLWDITDPTNPVRIAQTQVTLIASSPGALPPWQFATANTFTAASVRNPPIVAFYSAQEAAGGAGVTDVYGRVLYPAAQNGDSYTAAVTDPNGAVPYTRTVTATAGNGGYTNPNIDFSLSTYFNGKIGNTSPISVLGYSSPTFAVTLLDNTGARAGTLEASSGLRVLGFHVTSQWLDSGSGVLSSNIPTTATASEQGNLVISNDGDEIFGIGGSDAISEIQLEMNNAVAPPQDINFNNAGLHTTTFSGPEGDTWTATITFPGGGVLIDFKASGTNSLKPNEVLTSPLIYVNNRNGGCAGRNCRLHTRILPVHGNGALSLDPLAGAFDLTPTVDIDGWSSASNASGAIYHVGYVPVAGGAVTLGSDAHHYTTRSKHGVYQQPPLAQSATGYYDVWRYDMKATAGTYQYLQLTLPPTMDGTNVLPYNRLTGVTGGSAYAATACAGAPGKNFLCFNAGGAGFPATTAIYFALPPPSQAFGYQDILPQLNNAAGYQPLAIQQVSPLANPSPAPTVYDDPFLTSVDAFAIAGYSLDSTAITAGITPSQIGQNLAGYPVTLQLTNAASGVGSYPDDIDAIVVDVADQGGQTLTANGSPSVAGWSLSSPTTTGAGGVRRYWFTVCPTELTPNDSYGPTATAANGASINATACNTTAGWKTASLASAASLTIPLLMKTATGNIALTVYAHGANGGGWSAGIPLTVTVSGSTATSGFVGTGAPGAVGAITPGTQPMVPPPTDPVNGEGFLYRITNTGNTNLTSFAITIPGKDVSGALAYDGTNPWTITSAPTLQNAAGEFQVYGCTFTTPTGASNFYTSATTTGTDGHIFVSGCSIPPNHSVDVAFNALYPLTPNDTYAFPLKFDWTTFNVGSNTTDGASAAPNWLADQTVQVANQTQLTVYVPTPGTTTYAALTPATRANPAVNLSACTGCAFINNPNTVDFGFLTNGQTKDAVDSALVRISNGTSPRGWKLYAQTSYNLAYSGGGSELQTAFDLNDSTPGVSLQSPNGATYVDLPLTSPGVLVADTGSQAGIQAPYDLLMNFQLQIGTETQVLDSVTATVTYTWIAN